MWTLKIILALTFSFLSFYTIYSQSIPEDSLYLGNTQPGDVAKVFNLQVTAGFKACERVAISRDGREIYYSEINTYPPSALRIKSYKYENNKWNGPVVVFEGFMAPRFADNDSTLLLQDNHFYTYFSKRESSGWSTPVKLISTSLHTHYLQKTGLNNYFSSSYYEGSGGVGDICKVENISGNPVLVDLGIPLNSSMQENDFWIANDESYLIFSRAQTGSASDMYISFKKENGKWTNPKSLGATVNKPGAYWEYGQFISNDGKYLFFTSGGTSWGSYYTYWVRIDNLIDSLRNTNFAPYLNNRIPAQSGIPGQGYSFTIPDSIFVDDDGNNSLTLSVTLANGNPLPSWLSFNPMTRTFSGTPPDAVNLSIKVTAKDNANASVSTLFDLNIVLTGMEEKEKNTPGTFEVFQNYPNPFNPSTTIKFSIAVAGRYKLSLLSSLGENVKVISDRYYDPGFHEEVLNSKGLSSGVYIYVLNGDDKKIARKLTILQ